MRFVALAAVAILWAGSAAQAAPLSPAEQDLDTCMRASAATDHVALKDVDKGACQCATADLRKTLKPSDFDLHERMLEIIASGADEKTFNKQMSDVMLQRGMNQNDADAFLARSKAAERKAQDDCDASIMLDPEPNKAGH
jgi:hypothetical protein